MKKIPTPYENYLNDEERNISDYKPHVDEVLEIITDGTKADVIESELRENVDYYRLTITEAKRRVVKLHGGSVNAVAGETTDISEICDPNGEYTVKAKVLESKIKTKGTKNDGTPRMATEALIEDATDSIKVLIWTEMELTVGNEYLFKRCRYNDKFNNLTVNSKNDVVDRGESKEGPAPAKKIENTVNLSDAETSNGKWARATVVSYVEGVARNGTEYKRVTLKDGTAIKTFSDWANREYTAEETITFKIEVNDSNGRKFLNISKDSKIIRER